MTSIRHRLGAVLLLFAALALAVTVARSNTTTQKTVHPAHAKSSGSATTTYSGTSDKGEFEDALESAIQSALESRKGVSDAMVDWRLKEISGTQGGIGGFHKLTVTIEVKPR